MGENYQRNDKNKTKVLLVILSGLLVIAIAAAAILLIHGKMSEKSYMAAITSAEKSLAQKDYEDAIIQYKKAISEDPGETESYIGLSNVYVEQNQLSKARAILKRGYAKTNSAKIKLLYDRLMESENVEEDDTIKETKAVDPENASEQIGWNTSFLQQIKGFTYEDYREEYGSAERIETDSDGFMEVAHHGFDGTCYYRNTDENKNIVDSSRNRPEAAGMPEKISVNSLEILFRNYEGAVNLSRIQMLIGERIEPKIFNDRTIIEIQMEDCIIRIETDSEGNIVSPNAWNEILLLNANAQERKNGMISGVVLDAISGDGVKDAELNFDPEDSRQETKKARTNAAGEFEIELEAGVYEIKIQADGYVTEEVAFTVEEEKTYSGEQFVISPELAQGTARIVLEWNAEPQDLDSHLDGETAEGENVDVYYGNKREKSGDDVIAELDLDDRNGYGPETITIHDLNGTYTYSVEDYTRTGRMKEYGATVKVYLPGKPPQTITIDPEANVENVWLVCEIDHGELRIINQEG